MINQIIKIRSHKNEQQKELVQKAITATLSKNGIVVSQATTVKEICAIANYNRSVELPIYCVRKLKIF